MVINDDLDDEDLWQEAHGLAEASGIGRRPIVDRFLLAIIDRHPVKGADREHRLAGAKEALLGVPKPRGRSNLDDHLLLMEMANVYVSERCELELRIDGQEQTPLTGTTSVRNLANEAARVDPGQSLASTVDRLRKKFADDKRAYVLMAEHSVERDEAWSNSEITGLLDELGMSDTDKLKEDLEF